MSTSVLKVLKRHQIAGEMQEEVMDHFPREYHLYSEQRQIVIKDAQRSETKASVEAGIAAIQEQRQEDGRQEILMALGSYEATELLIDKRLAQEDLFHVHPLNTVLKELEQNLAQMLETESKKTITQLNAGYIEERSDKGKVVKVKLSETEVAAHKAKILSTDNDIVTRTQELAKRDHQEPYEFSLGFANVMTATVDAAPMIAQGIFTVDRSNPVSTLMTVFFCAPFGVSAAAQAISSFAKATKKYHINEKMDKLHKAFHPNTAKHTLANLCLDITFAMEEDIVKATSIDESITPSQAKISFDRYISSALKFLKGSAGFTDTPAMLAGKACALKALEAIYDDKKVPASPASTFPERLTDWCLKNLASDSDISNVTEELSATFSEVAGGLALSQSGGCVIC